VSNRSNAVPSASRALGGTVVANVMIAVVGTAAAILSARLLGPKGRGELTAIQLWPTLLAILASFGMPEALVYLTAKTRGTAGGQLGTAMTIGSFTALVFGAFGYLALPFLLAAQPQLTVAHARTYLLVIPLYIVTLLPCHPLRSRNAFLEWNLLRVAPGVAWLIIVAGAYILGTARPATLADAYLLALGCLSLPVFLIVRRIIPGPYWPSRSIGRSLLAYGLPAVTTTLPQLANLRLDQLVMAGFVPAAQLGYYVVAVTWSAAASLVLIAVGMVLFPSVAGLADAGERFRAVASVSRVGLALSIGLSCVVALATPTGIVVLASARFRPAIVPALVLVGAGTIYGYNYVLAEGIRGLGHPRTVLWAELGGACVTIVSLWWLLREMGIVGAAISSVLGYSVTMLLLVNSASRLLKCSLSDLLLPRKADWTIIAEGLGALLQGVRTRFHFSATPKHRH